MSEDLFGPCGKPPPRAVACGRGMFHEGPCGNWTVIPVGPLDPPMETVELEAHARRSDPDTSHEAARKVGNPTVRQDAVLALLKRYGAMTDPQIELAYMQHREYHGWPDQTPQSLRSRRSELVKLHGLVRDTGRRGASATGKSNAAKVWEAV